MKKEIRHGGSKAYFAKRKDRYDNVAGKWSWTFKLVAAPLDAFDVHSELRESYYSHILNEDFYLLVFNKEWWTGDLKEYAEDISNKATDKMTINHAAMRYSSGQCINCNELFFAESGKIKFCCNDCQDAHRAKNRKTQSR